MSTQVKSFAARKPTARAAIGTIPVPVNSVTLYHTINTLPYAEFSVALDSAPSSSGLVSVGGVQIDIASMNTLSKVLQEKFYNSFSLNPDVTLDIWDGDGAYDEKNKAWGNHIQFIGFMGNPSFQVQNGQFMMVITVMHSMCRLQAFNASIYSNQALYATAQDVFGDPLENAFSDDVLRDDSIAHRLFALIYYVMNNFTQSLQNTLDPTKITAAQKKENQTNPVFEPVQWNVHVLNQQLLPTLLKVIRESAEWTKIDGLSDGKGGMNPYFSDIPLHRTLYDTLFNSPTLLDTFSAILPVFMFQMNATWSDTLRIEHLQTMELPRSMIVVPVGALNFSLASMFEVPTLQVIARGPASDFYGTLPVSTESAVAPLAPSVAQLTQEDAAEILDQSHRILGRYPKLVPTDKNNNPIPGRYLYVEAPYWVGEDSSLMADLQQVIDDTKDPRELAVAKVNTNIEARLDNANVRENFLNYFARYTFKDVFLDRTTARISIPLLLTPQVGRTYFLRTVGQTSSMYVGYLQSVTHTLNINEQSGAADTMLTFTHIVARSADLISMSLGDIGYTQAAMKTAEDELNAAVTKGQVTYVSPF